MKTLTITFLFLSSLSDAATNTDPPVSTPGFFNLQYCEAERAQFCSDKNMSELGHCLISHMENLSVACKQDIERYVQLRSRTSSWGGGALSAFGGLNAFGPPVPLASYNWRYSPGSSPPSINDSKGNISFPVFTSTTDIVSLSLAGETLLFGSPVILSSGTQIPTFLYRVELGSQYFHRLPETKNWSLRTSVGYAGDAPFLYSPDMTFSINANYGFKSSEQSSWFFSIFFSNNNPLGNYIPIPGFGYLYKTEKFTGLIGAPASALQWTPLHPWAFSLSYFGLSAQLEADYGDIDTLQIFAIGAWTNQSYIPSQRLNYLDRLVLQETKVGLGLRSPLWSSLLAELQGGRVFNRSVFEGQSLFNQDGGSASLSDDWYLSLDLKARL